MELDNVNYSSDHRLVGVKRTMQSRAKNGEWSGYATTNGALWWALSSALSNV